MAQRKIDKLPLIYFSRHGQTDWNVISRIQGSLNTDINAVGRAQAIANGEKLRGFIGKGEGFRFVASPLRRTCETMERIRAAMDLPPKEFDTDAALREICFGDWQGFRIEEIAANRPEAYQARLRDKWNFRPAGEEAETYALLAERALRWLETVEQKTVCVTHGGWLRTLFYHFGYITGDEAANSMIPQDKILKLEHGRLTWL